MLGKELDTKQSKPYSVNLHFLTILSFLPVNFTSKFTSLKPTCRNRPKTASCHTETHKYAHAHTHTNTHFEKEPDGIRHISFKAALRATPWWGFRQYYGKILDIDI